MENDEKSFVRNRLLDILCAIDQVCQRHKIKYWLAWGSLLGAVRHHGFIPWDDDLDIWMPRKDYRRFREIAEKEMPSYFRTIDLYNTKEYILRFMKVQETRRDIYESVSAMSKIENAHGFYVDIFPLDGRPEPWFRQWILSIRLFFARQYLIEYCYRKGGNSAKKLVSRLIGSIAKLFLTDVKTEHQLMKKVERWTSAYDFWSSRHVGFVGPLQLIGKWFFSVDWFQETKMVQFEGYQFPVPGGYDGILSKLYGDYMQLPPENQRVSGHANMEQAPWLYGPTGDE